MKKMIKNIIPFFILLCTACNQQQPKADDHIPVDAIAVPVKNGWGYEIYVDNKMYIKQDHIPAVSGTQQFASREQALITAHLVLAKMKEGKKPLITINELKKAGINISN
jgi:Domain of unknown function (DUF4907)